MYYRCREAFVTRIDGARVSIAVGDLVEDSEDVYKARPTAFETVDDYMAKRRARRGAPRGRAAVEQASAAPGEMRSLTKPPTPRRARSTAGKGKTQEGDK
ncbi:hypothetical protein [Streptomyces sp. KR55]|uniref:hypothetical protein n=1 Tax=Streptomyces sp. KR55 TaxID=3457425 RepID=UPI003FD0BED4